MPRNSSALKSGSFGHGVFVVELLAQFVVRGVRATDEISLAASQPDDELEYSAFRS
jgi:hypothetical protein